MYAEVALQRLAIHEGTLLYAIPEELATHIQPGVLVQVPYKQSTTSGIVVALREQSPYPKTKAIIQCYHTTPLLTPLQLSWAISLSAHYLTPINKVLSVFLPSKLWEGTWNPKKEVSYTLINTSYKPSPRAAKESLALAHFQKHPCQTESFLKEQHITSATLKKLVQKEVLSRQEGALLPTLPYTSRLIPLSTLTEAQTKALKQLRSGHATYLLHGITGSGKTEIYVHLAAQMQAEGKQTIILVPEIALTGQMIATFQRHFGNTVAILHSHRSDTERAQEWHRIRTGEATIIIGSRLALFAPVLSPAMIIIDEEHDWSYKSDQSPRYHAITAAHLLYHIQKYTLVLGSATPSIESYYRAEQGTYILVELMQRYY